jgi:hypothetical protein
VLALEVPDEVARRAEDPVFATLHL